MGDGHHSFGHGSHCYWCGVDGNSPEIEKPCDEREHKKPSEASMVHYGCTSALDEADYELRQAQTKCERAGYSDIARDVNAVRVRLADAVRKLEAQRPLDERGVSNE